MAFTLYTLILSIGFALLVLLNAEDHDGPSDDQRGGGGRRLAKIPIRTDEHPGR